MFNNLIYFKLRGRVILKISFRKFWINMGFLEDDW